MKRLGTPIRLATRGSDLALRQATAVRAALEAHRYGVELVEVETTGDQVRDELIHRLGRTGAFVRALDEQVIAGEADAAVHSMKDVPTEIPTELVVAGVPERAPPGDALVTPDGSSLQDLPAGATVGTASLRRRAQVLAGRPDLSVEPIRGNVDTRIEKLLAPGLQAEHERLTELEAGEGDTVADEDGNGADDASGDDQSADEWFAARSEIERRALGRQVEAEYDAVVLARAGLERTGLVHQVERVDLPTGTFVPAPGQGALAITARDDDVGEAIHDATDHPRTRVETTAERVVLAELGGGCIAPIGIYAVVRGEHVHVEAQVADRDGEEVISLARDLHVESYVDAAREMAAELADRGARELIEEAKRE